MSISQRRMDQERLKLKPGYKQWALVAPLGNKKVQRFIILKDHAYEGEYPSNPLQTEESECYLCGVQGEVGKRQLTDLPEDIIIKITSHLKYKDLNNLRLVRFLSYIVTSICSNYMECFITLLSCFLSHPFLTLFCLL